MDLINMLEPKRRVGGGEGERGGGLPLSLISDMNAH